MTQPLDPASLRVWFVHDWLTGMRGGEKVLLELVRMFPESRIATLVHVAGSTDPEIDRRVARTSFLQKMPNIGGTYRNYLPLFPRAIRSMELDGECDLVISVSHAVAKGISIPEGPGGGKPHVCFCNTPMRYIWGMEDQYLPRWSPKRLALAAVIPGLRGFDRQNGSVTRFVANSGTVAERIRRIYRREAVVVHPGIDEGYYTVSGEPREDFYLMVSALVPYKRVDLAVRAFAGTVRKLVIIGGGPEEGKLRRMAEGSGNIEFMGRQPDDVVLRHYQRCRAFLFPGEEDFGLTPVEAQACGAPVIAYGAGGATETVVAGRTGVFFAEQTVGALREAVERFEKSFAATPEAIRENALRFTWGRFRRGMVEVVRGVVGN
ncbi:MAG TPA: glycosyltransferase [Phycisphaerae bacterium]|nr:glycosyltransferase [Phycisphaerae bacterium]